MIRNINLEFKRTVSQRGTYHSSKGLEADLVFLLDDAQPPEEHPLRERAFQQLSLLGQDVGTYKQTMSDEARRLAYVALTRARLGIVWVPLTEATRGSENGSQPAATNNNQSTASISAQGCFVLVKNHLQAKGR